MPQTRFLRAALLMASLLSTLMASAQPKFSQPHGLYESGTLKVSITGSSEGADIR